jgi:hypothetical protein
MGWEGVVGWVLFGVVELRWGGRGFGTGRMVLRWRCLALRATESGERYVGGWVVPAAWMGTVKVANALATLSSVAGWAPSAFPVSALFQ